MNKLFKTIKFRLPALIIFGLLVVASLVTSLSYYKAIETIENSTLQKFDSFNKLYSSHIEKEDSKLSLAMSVLLNNPNISRLFYQKKRDDLTNALLPIYNNVLKPKYHIAQFQFHSPPATSFLRLHKPTKFGDDLSHIRGTIVKSNREKRKVSGIEVGRFGPGYRVVFPVSYNNQHIGAVEFGSSLVSIIKEITKILNLDYAIGIKSDVFTNAGKKGITTKDVVNNNTIFYEQSNKSYNSLLKDLELTETIKSFELDSKNIATITIPLLDYNNQNIGVITLFEDRSENVAQIYNSVYLSVSIVLLMIFILGIAGYYISTNYITKPLEETSQLMGKIASGDLTGRVNFKSGNEFIILSNSMNSLQDSFVEIINNMRTTQNALLTASTQLTNTSSDVTSSMADVSSEITTVASATEQMSSNISNMSATAEEMSINANNVATSSTEMSDTTSSVAAAVEEMRLSISDVLKNSNESTSIANEAANMSGNATETMKDLGSAANEIGKVTEVIKRIAEQTNLLALNATIEAASAGEAGKGFAVVANEIKELANQSATAAEDIASKITSVQENTTNAITVIDNVSLIIEKLNTSSETIKNSVEQQTEAVNSITAVTSQSQEATENITRNIAEVAQGSTDLAQNASESAEGANEVSRSIHAVNETTTTISTATEEFNSSAVKLANIAEDLKSIIGQFKI